MKETKLQVKAFLRIFPKFTIYFIFATVFFATNKVFADEVSPIPTQNPTLVITTPIPTNTAAPTSAPLGPVLYISFNLPGIGSGEANINPLHQKRDVTIYLYGPDANSADSHAKPLFTINTYALYNNDPLSPTYTYYWVTNLDLGSKVPNGHYQIVFKTNQSLRKLIKDRPEALGGTIFSLERNVPLNTIPLQKLILGDISPQNGDNVIDINDYNLLVNCFSNKSDTTLCPNRQLADLDDNGIVDGVDYNLLLLTFKSLLSQGLPVPTFPSPTLQSNPISGHLPSIKVAVPTVPVIVKKVAQNSAIQFVFFFLFLFFLLIVGAGVYFFIRRKKHQAYLASLEASLGPTSTIIKGEATPAEPAKTKEKSANAQITSDDEVSKEYYIQKHSTDEKNGFWLTLTDDNGPIPGYYTGKEVAEGFATVKGVIKIDKDKGKPYVLVSEIIEEKS